MEYWSTHCGNDGYLYLLFQRRFLKLTVWISAIGAAFTVIMNAFRLEGENNVDDED
jgi:hypothetical protein